MPAELRVGTTLCVNLCLMRYAEIDFFLPGAGLVVKVFEWEVVALVCVVFDALSNFSGMTAKDR